jgi:putative Mg2+ transporter-C (MgtC) family protein
MCEHGYRIAGGLLVIIANEEKQEWRFAAIALQKDSSYSIPAISRKLTKINGVEKFQLSFSRN